MTPPLAPYPLPATVTLTLPAYLLSQYRDATATRDRLYRAGKLTAREEAELDMAEDVRSDARQALRDLAATEWKCNPDQLVEAMA